MLGNLLRDLAVGCISGVISGYAVFWLLSQRVPKVRITHVSQAHRIEVTVQNIRRSGILPKFLRAMVENRAVGAMVENRAELHIVSSVGVTDPPRAQGIPFFRADPLVIWPDGSFVFRTRCSSERIQKLSKSKEAEWKNDGENVENIGIRFRVMSRDAFSNAAKSEEMGWYLRTLLDGSLKVETSIQYAAR